MEYIYLSWLTAWPSSDIRGSLSLTLNFLLLLWTSLWEGWLRGNLLPTVYFSLAPFNPLILFHCISAADSSFSYFRKVTHCSFKLADLALRWFERLNRDMTIILENSEIFGWPYSLSYKCINLSTGVQCTLYKFGVLRPILFLTKKYKKIGAIKYFESVISNVSWIASTRIARHFLSEELLSSWPNMLKPAVPDKRRGLLSKKVLLTT